MLDFAKHAAHSLQYSLDIDWTQVDEVEVRYRDGSTEVLNIATDPTAKERLRLAVAISIPET